jgi:GTPase
MIKSKNKEYKLVRKDFRKGMFLIDGTCKAPISAWYFSAEILVLHHSTTIKEGYQC